MRRHDAACYHSQSDNEYILDDFTNGRLKCLVNVNIHLNDRLNFPIADMCVLIRATESTALYVQIVGRVMRLYPKKNALLLDYGGNVLRPAVLMM